MRKVFNPNPSTINQAMFFPQGEAENGLGVARFDQVKYQAFVKSYETQTNFFWNPAEHNLTQDRIDFQGLPIHEQQIFTETLQYQILLDSIQGRAPSIALTPYVGLSELENAIAAWTFFETLHSFSYQHIISSVYTNPSVVFEQVLEVPEIVARAKVVTSYYDDFIDLAGWYQKLGYGTHKVTEHLGTTQETTFVVEITEKKLKKLLYKMLVNIYILEGVRFYASFACSFAFGERKKMVGNANVISQIARDESQHLVIVATILKNYERREGDKVMQEVIKECREEVTQMFIDAVDTERTWCRFVFRNGGMLGMNAPILETYVEGIGSTRMRTLGLEPPHEWAQDTKSLPWMEHWLNSKSVQEAPQEIEKTSYLIGGYLMDITPETFAGFKL